MMSASTVRSWYRSICGIAVAWYYSVFDGSGTVKNISRCATLVPWYCPTLRLLWICLTHSCCHTQSEPFAPACLKLSWHRCPQLIPRSTPQNFSLYFMQKSNTDVAKPGNRSLPCLGEVERHGRYGRFSACSSLAALPAHRAVSKLSYNA